MIGNRPTNCTAWMQRSVLLIAGLAAAGVCLGQTSQPANAKKPSFSIAISMPQVIKAESELLLEIVMTNTSEKDISYGIVFGEPPWQEFGIDLRDATGHPVPKTPAGYRSSLPLVGSAIRVPLAPGEVTHPQIILNRVYDLSQPGEYTVAVRRLDYASEIDVKSNTLTFRVPPSPQPHGNRKPAFAISLTTPFDSVKTGWQIPVQVAVKNLSDKGITLAVWEGLQNAAKKEPDESGFGWDVRDGKGNPVPLTKEGQALFNRDELPIGSFRFVPIEPGVVVEETRVVGGIYDVGSPGNYSVQVVLIDPTTNLPVKSNTLSLAVSDSAGLHPPFIITISSTPNLMGGNEVGLRICRTNISDHRIMLDNGTYLDEISVRDGQGAPVPLTEEGRKERQVEHYQILNGVDRTEVSSAVQNLQPGKNLCGEMSLNVDWDLSKPGKYSIQIIQPDYPDKAPGQKIEDLPTVKSNTIPWTVSQQH